MLNLSDLGQRSMSDLDLGLSKIVMYSFLTICTNFHLRGFNSSLANLSHTKTKGTKFDIVVK